MIENKMRKAHHHGNLKEALLNFALNAAREGTVETLSLRHASRELGVSPGAVYRHFPDKAALMRTLAQKGFDLLAVRFEAAMPFESHATTKAQAKQRFITLGLAYAAFAAENYGLWRLMFGPFGRQPVPDREDRASTYDWLAKSLAELSEFGLIGKTDAEAQFFVWTTIHGMSDLQASPPVPIAEREQVTQTQCELVLAALQ